MALNRLNDYLFKWLFGNEKHKGMLLDLINAILTDGSDENVIVDFSFTDRELDPKKLDDKRVTLDILGETSSGTTVNIEVQVENNHDIDHRMLYYWARNFSMQLETGADYRELKDTICICIMNFNYFDRDRYHSCYKVLETIDHTPLNNDMQIHFIELKKWAALKRKPTNRLERWLLYLANSDAAELVAVAAENPYIASAIAAEDYFILDEGERYYYDMREKFLNDQSSIAANTAKLQKKVALAEKRADKAEFDKEQERLAKEKAIKEKEKAIEEKEKALKEKEELLARIAELEKSAKPDRI